MSQALDSQPFHASTHTNAIIRDSMRSTIAKIHLLIQLITVNKNDKIFSFNWGLILPRNNNILSFKRYMRVSYPIISFIDHNECWSSCNIHRAAECKQFVFSFPTLSRNGSKCARKREASHSPPVHCITRLCRSAVFEVTLQKVLLNYRMQIVLRCSTKRISTEC